MARYEYESIFGASEIVETGYEAEDELYVNGVTLSSLLDGYAQISVAGRHLLSPEVEVKRNSSRDGAKPVSVSYPPRNFVVRYILRAKDSEDLRDKTDAMMDILRGELEVKFKDSPDYVYQGVLMTGSEEVEETANTVVSSFTLTAFDPYRYTEEPIESEVIDTSSEYIKAEEIRIEFSRSISRPTITVASSGYGFELSFRLVGTYNTGDVVKVKQSRDGMIYVEGGSIELGTLTEELVLFKGSRGEIEEDNSAGKVKFRWRDRRI